MPAFASASDRLNALTDGVITGIDSLANLLTGGGAAGEPEYIWAHKDGRIGGAATPAYLAGMMASLWLNEGTPLPHGAVPTTFAIPDNTTVGGLLQANPGGGRKKLLVSAHATSQIGGALILYDRLLHVGGFDGNVTTTQNVNGGASADVTRYTDGVGNILCMEIYTAIGTTARNFTAVYKDGAGAAQTTKNIAAGSAQRDQATMLMPLSLAAGGSTVSGVTSCAFSVGGTGVSGNFGLTIMHPLIMIPISAGSHVSALSDFLCASVPAILPNACLALAYVAGTATRTSIDAFFTSVEA